MFFHGMITFILVSTRQLPTKWAEYPTPLLVLKLKEISCVSVIYGSYYVFTNKGRVSPSQC